MTKKTFYRVIRKEILPSKNDSFWEEILKGNLIGTIIAWLGFGIFMAYRLIVYIYN